MEVNTEKRVRLILCLLALLHAAFTFIFAMTRIYSFKASLLDIGTFDQLYWGLLHYGAPLSTTNQPFTAQHWLGFHFSPLLVIILPLYALWPHLETLQLFQSLCFAGAAIPLFYAAMALGARRREASFCVLLYWFNPLLLSAALWDFHEIALSTFIIAVALWALSAKRFTAFCISLIFLLLTKEHYGVSVAGFGFLWGWRYREWKRGSIVMLSGIAAMAVIIAVIMPFFSGGPHPMLADSGNQLSRYSWLAASLPLRRKIEFFIFLFMGNASPEITGFLHVILLALSGLFFLFAAPFYLAPAAGEILANLLSANPMPRHIAAYHAAACIPVIIIAAVKGFLWLQSKRPSARPLLYAAAIAMAAVFPCTGLTSYSFSIWELRTPVLAMDEKPVQDIRALMGDAPASLQPNIGMFFSHRRELYPFPFMIAKTDFAVLHLFQPFSDPRQEHFGIPYGLSTLEYAEAVTNFLLLTGWHIEYWNPPWLVMKRGPATRDEKEDRKMINRALGEMLRLKAR